MNDGAAGLLVLLGLCFATLLGAIGLPALLIGVRTRRALAVNAEHERLWPALAKIVNGTYREGTLTGEYAGLSVRATITRTRPMEPGGQARYYHQLIARTAGQSRGRDWELHNIGENDSGAEQADWRVDSDDQGLQRRLVEAGVIDIVRQTPGIASVLYRADQGALISLARVAGATAVPEPAPFSMQLDMLARLAQLNGQVNDG